MDENSGTPEKVKKAAVQSLMAAFDLTNLKRRTVALTMEDAAKLEIARAELRALNGEQVFDTLDVCRCLFAGRL